METINIESARNEIINKSRELIIERYDYDYLLQRFELSDRIPEEAIADIRNYFLNNLYPDPDQRKKLEDAFGNLGTYMHEPKKVLGLFGNITKAVFKFGMDFRKVFGVGLNALKAFKVTTRFEQIIKDTIENKNLELPIEMGIYKSSLTEIPKSDVESYTVSVLEIFETMVDERILSKTLGILDNIIATMKKKSKLYPKKDVEGLSLGRDMLVDALSVFSKYDTKTKKEIISLIQKNEKDFLDELYESSEDA